MPEGEQSAQGTQVALYQPKIKSSLGNPWKLSEEMATSNRYTLIKCNL